jgi:hypothetical protein
MALILKVFFIGIPVVVVAQANVKALYFITTGIIFVVCASILNLIFIPKVLALRISNRRRNPSYFSLTSSNSEDNVVQLEQEIQGLKRLFEIEASKSSTHRENAAAVVSDDAPIAHGVIVIVSFAFTTDEQEQPIDGPIGINDSN